MQLDVVTGSERPWLATAATWSRGGTTLTIELRKGIIWSDGTPFTATDVAFRFNLIRTSPGLNLEDMFLVGVKAVSPTKVVLTMSESSYEYFDDIVGQVIVPAHLWKNVKDPVAHQDL
jgi:peptide/nickel transport system substrate-binding protein